MIVDPDFCDHWKTRLLIGALDYDEAAPVYVLRLWAHCQNRRQWVFDNLSPEALKALCRFPGPSNKLDASLSASGFISRDAKTVTICNWDEYNSSLIASWKNGKKGGRPSGKKPDDNPCVTGSKPTGLRLDEMGLDLKNVLVGAPEGENAKPRSVSTSGDSFDPSELDYRPRGYETFLTGPDEHFKAWWALLPPKMAVGVDGCWLIWKEVIFALSVEKQIDQETSIGFVMHRTRMFLQSPKGQREVKRVEAKAFLKNGVFKDNPESWEDQSVAGKFDQKKPRVKRVQDIKTNSLGMIIDE